MHQPKKNEGKKMSHALSEEEVSSFAKDSKYAG